MNVVEALGLASALVDCLKRCATDLFGITTILGLIGFITGLDILPKGRRGLGGASRRTSIASKLLRRVKPLQKTLPWRVPTPTRANLLARSRVVAVVIERWMPWIGAAFLTYNAVSIALCVIDCLE